MLIDDNCCTYQMIQKELKIRSTPKHKIIYEELYMKIWICHWLQHNLTEQQKAKCVRICRETLKVLNEGGHWLISKIITGNETYIAFFDIPTGQESKLWVFEDHCKPTVVKK